MKSLLILGWSVCALSSCHYLGSNPFTARYPISPYEVHHPDFGSEQREEDQSEMGGEQSPPQPDNEDEQSQRPVGYATAERVPGKPGYVYNPFTRNMVDVRNIPSGTLVRDPHDPDLSHKFRTP